MWLCRWAYSQVYLQQQCIDIEVTSLNFRMRLSIIIPVLHERAIINESLRKLMQLPEINDCEIIVVDGDTDAGTLSGIEVGLLSDIRTIRGAQGRARQMNAGAAVAKGDFLLFHHVDSALPDDGIFKILAAMTNQQVSGGAFSISLASRRFFLRALSLFGTLRSRWTAAPFGDQSIFIRTRIFRELGGYLELPLMEDLDLMLRMKRAGYRILILPEKVTTSARRFEREGPVFCALTDLFLYLLFHAGIDPTRLKHLYPDVR